jgi:CDP-diglyceride synthetase
MTKMQPNHILILLLVYIAALSAMASYLEVMHIAEPQWSVILTSLLASSLIFWWYWADSTSRSYRRSPLLNVAVVAVAFVAVPYYLVRSRERGRRLPALGKMLGFFLLMVVALVVGALPFAFIG